MRYIVSVRELAERVSELQQDGMDFAVLEYMEPDNSDPDDPIPAELAVQGIQKKSPHGWPDYDPLELVDSSKI